MWRSQEEWRVGKGILWGDWLHVIQTACNLQCTRSHPSHWEELGELSPEPPPNLHVRSMLIPGPAYPIYSATWLESLVHSHSTASWCLPFNTYTHARAHYCPSWFNYTYHNFDSLVSWLEIGQKQKKKSFNKTQDIMVHMYIRDSLWHCLKNRDDVKKHMVPEWQNLCMSSNTCIQQSMHTTHISQLLLIKFMWKASNFKLSSLWWLLK